MTATRPRALWLIKGLGTGGAERLLVNTAAALGDEVDVEVVHLWRQPDRMRPELEAAGVPVFPLDVASAGDVRWLYRLRRLVLARGYDVVHVHGANVAVLYRLLNLSLPRRGRPRVVVTQHNDWHLIPWRARRLEQATYRLDSARFAVSRSSWDSLPRRMRERTSVLIHGVPLDAVRALRSERAQVRAELGVGPSDVVAMTIANVRPEKGYPTLVAAASSAVARAPALRFVAVGGSTPAGEAGLRQLLRHAGLRAQQFSYLGVRSDAARLLAGADVFVLASSTEGFPIALMEALCVGLPVVSSAVGGIPEAVRDGVEGLLVPPARPDLLSDALVRLAEDTGLRQAMATAAAERGACYDIRLAARRTAEVYRELAAGSSARSDADGNGSPTTHPSVRRMTPTSESSVRRRR